LLRAWYGDGLDEVILCPDVNYEVVPAVLPYAQYAWNVAKRAFWKKTMEALAQLKVYMTGLEITDTAIASVEARYDRIQKLVDAQDE